MPSGLIQQVRSCISIMPDDPQGPNDPHCRYIGGYIFGYDMGTDSGPYTTLPEQWAAIYRDWLPASGEVLLDAPPMELCINNPSNSPHEKLHTEIWIPLAPR